MPNKEQYKYDTCTNNPYLKCSEEGLCIECLRLENKSAKKWIAYTNNMLQNEQTEKEIKINAI